MLIGLSVRALHGWYYGSPTEQFRRATRLVVERSHPGDTAPLVGMADQGAAYYADVRLREPDPPTSSG